MFDAKSRLSVAEGGYLVLSNVEDLDYATETFVGTALSGYSTTDQMNTAISTALSAYSTTTVSQDYTDDAIQTAIDTTIDAMVADSYNNIINLGYQTLHSLALAGFQVENSTSSSVTTIYVDPATGNDTTGDGTAPLPFATVHRAKSALAQFPNAQNVISCAAGTVSIAGFFGTNSVTLQGTLTAGTTLTIGTVTQSSATLGSILICTGVNVLANVLIGTLIKYTSGAANGIYGIVYGNTATAGGNTTLYISHGQGAVTFTAPIATNTLQIQTPATNFDGQASIRGGSITIQDGNITGNSAVLVGISPSTAMTMVRCFMTTIGAVNQTGGNLTLTTCYVATAGNSLRGILRSQGGSITFSSGCVLSGANAGGNNYILFQKGAVVDWAGNTVFRGLSGIRWESAHSVVTTPGTFNTMIFENLNTSNTTAILVNTAASGTGAGGSVFLPNLHGAVSGARVASARLGAQVSLGSGSTIVGSGVNAAVTVDGSTDSSWDPVGTIIYNGVPLHTVANNKMQFLTMDSRTLTNAGTAQLSTDGVLIFTINGAQNLQLLATSLWLGRWLWVRNLSSSTASVTILRGGSDLIEGSASIAVAAGAWVALYAGPSNTIYKFTQ